MIIISQSSQAAMVLLWYRPQISGIPSGLIKIVLMIIISKTGQIAMLMRMQEQRVSQVPSSIAH
jgi:hypothetical protein